VPNLPGYELTGQGKSKPLLFRETELRSAQKDVFRVKSCRDAVKPPAHGKVTDWNPRLAESLDGLSRELNVTHDVQLANFAQSHFDFFVLSVSNLEDLGAFTHTSALGVQV